jgi:hypothetical protein
MRWPGDWVASVSNGVVMLTRACATHLKHKVSVFCIEALWLLLFAGIAQSAPVLDQEHAPIGNFGALAVAADRTQIQTFTVGITGALARIDFQVARQPQTVENLDFSLWSTNATGLPKDLLATVSVPSSALGPPFTFPFVTINLNPAVPVSEGDVLAIVLNSKAPNDLPPPAVSVRYLWEYGGQYARGTAYTQLGSSVFTQDEDLHFRTFVEALIRITIDIKRKSNRINPNSHGVIPVFVLTMDAFDAATVDSTTVRFGRAGTEAAVVHATFEDVNGDGRNDLVLHFRTHETGIQCGDTFASLTGRTVNGQPIQGSDAIVTVGCK